MESQIRRDFLQRRGSPAGRPTARPTGPPTPQGHADLQREPLDPPGQLTTCWEAARWCFPGTETVPCSSTSVQGQQEVARRLLGSCQEVLRKYTGSTHLLKLMLKFLLTSLIKSCLPSNVSLAILAQQCQPGNVCPAMLTAVLSNKDIKSHKKDKIQFLMQFPFIKKNQSQSEMKSFKQQINFSSF